jgi:hypothetical protein
MRVLEQADYLKIYLRAIQYNSIEKKEAYFLGKYNEHKECNPLPLFIDGLGKADAYFENIIRERYTKDLQEYQLACKVDADNKEKYVEPTLNSVEHPCYFIDNEMRGHYNYSNILKIRQGYMSFTLSILKDNPQSKPQPNAKPEPQLKTDFIIKSVTLAKIKSFDNPTALKDELRQIYDSEFEPYKNELAAKLGYKSPINQFGINKEIAKKKHKEKGHTPEPEKPAKEMPLTDAMIKDFIEQQKAKFANLLTCDYIEKRLQAKTYIEYLESRLNPKESQPEQIFTPKTDTLKDWLKPDYIKPFIEIEQGLFERGFIDANYKWLKSKKDLIDLLIVITDYRLFKERVLGKKMQSFHYRQFISKRYGFGKTGLTETGKKYKPTIEIARASFLWVKKPA